MEPAVEFIRLYNELDEHFKKVTRAKRLRTFPERVAELARHNASVRRWRDELRDFSELRNAIVHDRYYPERILATPTDEAVGQFRSIVAQILQPVTLAAQFSSAIELFRPQDPLSLVLRWLRDNEFSQAVVYDGQLSILSARAIARWLSGQTETECVMLSEATVAEAQAYEEPGSFIVMRQNNTLDEAREAFERELAHGQRKLFAILITQTGKVTQKPLGIITPWDLIEHDGD